MVTIIDKSFVIIIIDQEEYCVICVNHCDVASMIFSISTMLPISLKILLTTRM